MHSSRVHLGSILQGQKGDTYRDSITSVIQMQVLLTFSDRHAAWVGPWMHINSSQPAPVELRRLPKILLSENQEEQKMKSAVIKCLAILAAVCQLQDSSLASPANAHAALNAHRGGSGARSDATTELRSKFPF